ncbi:MAG: hypothetical protein CL678_18445 [Bdellovibrionaceae bacterium]|nr:hypothetical protein [Pseudobdellovibrionaceae bacterium]|tara:strand:+ start:890 stop:1672 length:783 start_codon:yes stop_codon:yes gene_type:complete
MIEKSILQLKTHLFFKYPFQWVMPLIQFGSLILFFFFLSNSIDSITTIEGKYFPFAFMGMILVHFYQTVSHASASQIRNWQIEGSFIHFLLSPYSLYRILFAAGIDQTLKEIIKLFVVIIFLKYVYFYESTMDIFFITLSFFLLFTLTFQLNLISSLSILTFKRFNILSVFHTIGMTLFTGSFIPIKVLPIWIQKIAFILPLTHIVSLFRFSWTNQNYEFIPKQSIAILVIWNIFIFIFLNFFYRKSEKILFLQGKISHL